MHGRLLVGIVQSAVPGGCNPSEFGSRGFNVVEKRLDGQLCRFGAVKKKIR